MNQLHGILPQDLGLKLPNLQVFNIASNEFSRAIPVSFPNASGLLDLDVGKNRFFGSIPLNLGVLEGLQRLVFAENNLGFGELDDLSFLISLTNCSNLKTLDITDNNFGGQLPSSMANLSTNLEELCLGGNLISGSIPISTHNFINLNTLQMESNQFMGSIPISIGKLYKLQGLDLCRDKLTGEIPSSLKNVTQLFELYLQENYLNGSIPSSLKYCQHLQEVDLSQNVLNGKIPQEVIALPSLNVLNFSHNSLMGSLPLELCKMKSLGTLDISHNKLSGEIPTQIGECSGMEFLFMQSDSFHGSIPLSMTSLRGIQYLDLSSNTLSRKIPQDLHKLLVIQYLNLSLKIVPLEGVFTNSSVISLTGNNKLCGGIPNLNLPTCPTKDREKHERSHTFKVILTLFNVVLFLTLITCFVIFYWRRKSRKDPPLAASSGNSYIRVSYHDLLKAIDGFASANLVDSGAFGAVYKGTLPQEEKPVAVKILNLQHKAAKKAS